MIAPHPNRRLLCVNLAVVALQAGCAWPGGLGGPPRVVLGVDEIARLVGRQFPQDRRLLDMLDVTLQAPGVRLLPDRNRLAAVLDLGVRERMLGGRWNGQLEFDSALRWEPRDRTLRLFQARVSDLKLVSTGAQVRTPAERLGAALVERVLEDMVLYTLPPERAEALPASGLAPAEVAVTARGVEITFSAAAR
ncbi:MAG: hypothetical protein HZC37_01155 [Burkholderiales bacterium]|nr:hypothetical protein [Burkholderiales bacterium]